MALSRRIFTHIVKSQHLRFCSEKSNQNFWDIVPKQWRKPRFQQPDKESLSAKLQPNISTVKFFNQLNPLKVPKLNLFKRDLRAEDQGYQDILDDESEQRGNTAAAAMCLVFNGAKVRFSSIPAWITHDENYDLLPRTSDISNHLVGVDISNLDIDYTTLKSIRDLNNVTVFKAQGCPNFDDYCLDYVTANFPMLEELDLRDCPLVSVRGLGTLYRLKRLRTLKLDGVPLTEDLELCCIHLEERFEKLVIEGISYNTDKTSVNM